jgi:hypothetical protein
VYTVEEVLGEGVTREPYTVSYPTPTNNNSEADVKAEIVNSYNVAKTQLTVTKSWDDNDNQDGIRPSAVNVQLYANGEFVEGTRTELNASNNWTKTWTDLFVNEDGEKIEYSVVEDEVIGYDSDAISSSLNFNESLSISKIKLFSEILSFLYQISKIAILPINVQS